MRLWEFFFRPQAYLMAEALSISKLFISYHSLICLSEARQVELVVADSGPGVCV
jgi:hypothetical protein